MQSRSKQATRGLGLVWFIIGLALVASDNAAGWVFFILGLSYLARTMGSGEAWADKNPKLARWVIAGLTVLVVLIAIGVLVLKNLQ